MSHVIIKIFEFYDSSQQMENIQFFFKLQIANEQILQTKLNR